MKKKIVKET